MGDFSYLLLVPTSVANIPIDWSRVPEASKEKLLQWAYDWDNLGVARPLPATIEDLAKMLDESKFFGYFEPDVCIMLMDISEFGLEEKSPLGHIKAGPRFYMKYLEQVWFLLFTPGKRDCIIGHSRDIITKDSDEDDSEEDYMENGDDTEDDTEDEADIDEADTEDEADMEAALAKEAEENKQYEEEKNEDNKETEEKLSDKKDGNEDDEDDNDDDDDEDYKPVQPGTAEEVALAQEFEVTLEKEVSQGMARMVKMTKKLGGWSAYNVQLPHLIPE